MKAELQQLVDALKLLSQEDRETVLEQFCKDCHLFIGDDSDWSGSNYCSSCSPDPVE